MIYFDNAATTAKKPICVINAVVKALRENSANPGRGGHTASQNAALEVFKSREKVSNFFGADGPENVIFTANCTQSLNFVIKGAVTKKSHIIVSDLEHNAVMRPLAESGTEYSVAEVSLENDEQTIRNFESLIKPNTKMILCTAASNVCGKILPLKALGSLCKSKDILFAVDAAQAAGVIPINMQRMNIDYLCIAPHKGLYAPMGIGILIARKPFLKTIIQGGTGNNSAELFQGLTVPEDFESGTVNLPAIMGVRSGIAFVENSIDKIYSHELQIIKRIYKGLLTEKNIRLYTPFPQKGVYAPVLSFNIEGVHSEFAAGVLNEKGIAVRAGLHCAPAAHKRLGTLETGTVRVAPSAFNTVKEADLLLKTLKNNKKFIK